MTREEAIAVLEISKHMATSGRMYNQAIDMAIEALNDAPTVQTEAVPQIDQYKRGFEDAKRAFLIEYARECENMRKRNAKLEVMLNAQKAMSAEAVQGEWKHKPSKSGEWVWWQCSECGAVIYSESEVDRKIHHAYCGVCGARMKGGDE